MVFFANLIALFYGNEAETAALAKEVGNIDSYGGRLIPVLDLLFSGGENCLVLEREPDASLCAYFEGSLNLRLPELRLMPHETYQAFGRSFEVHQDQAESILSGLRETSARLVDGYVTDPILTMIARHLEKETASTFAGSHSGNNKWLLHQHLEKAGLPVPLTEIAQTIEETPACLERLAKAGFRHAVLKSQIGASGIGIQKVPIDGTDRACIQKMLFYEGPCMVQGWLEPGVHGIRSIKSPSVQLFLDHERVCLYDLTEQILSCESVHEGNESPPPYLRSDEDNGRCELLRQAEIAARWLHGQGYRGTASVDFLLVQRDDECTPEVYVCEINARVTGATYPSVLARHFHPGCHWLMRNLKFTNPIPSEHLLQLLDKAGHLFTGGDEEGILPINFNLEPSGLVAKGQFLCIGDSSESCHRLLTLGEEDLPIDWDYVRD